MISFLVTWIGLGTIAGVWGIGFYCFYEDQMKDKRRP